MRYLLLSAALIATPAVAQVSITNATTTPTPDGGTARVTATIRSAANDGITGGSSPVADSVMAHTIRPTKGTQSAVMTPTVIPLTKGKSQRLSPGGYHIMLMGVNRSLKVGDTVPVTVNFTSGKPVTTMVKVVSK